MAVKTPKVGEWVAWPWLNGVAEGRVLGVYTEKHTISTKGKLVTRNGTKENPAIVMEHKSGNNVIKLASELLNTSTEN